MGRVKKKHWATGKLLSAILLTTGQVHAGVYFQLIAKKIVFMILHVAAATATFRQLQCGKSVRRATEMVQFKLYITYTCQ